MNKLIIFIFACLMTLTVAWAESGTDPVGDAVSFTALDADADGQISQEEAMSDPNLEDQFASIDLDSNGSLSVQEYSVYAGGAPAAGQPPASESPEDGQMTPGSE